MSSITAVIVAAGSGTRMRTETPKQFLEIDGKPVITYTVEAFEHSPEINDIILVCLEGWEEYARKALEGTSKLKAVICGGKTAMESIRNGIRAAGTLDNDDIVLVHDGVRPLVDEKAISDVIDDARRYGGAICAVPLKEHVAFRSGSPTGVKYMPRENAFRTITPQAYKYGNIYKAFRLADEKGIGADSPFIGTLMIDLGMPVCLTESSDSNIKLTTPLDMAVFREMLKSR